MDNATLNISTMVRNNFARDVTQRDGAKILKSVALIAFRNKGNESSIDSTM